MFKGLILTTLISAINVAPIATYRPTLYDLDYPQAEFNNYTLRQVFEEQVLPLPVNLDEYDYTLPDGTTFYGTDSGYYVQQIDDYTLVNIVSNSDFLIDDSSTWRNGAGVSLTFTGSSLIYEVIEDGRTWAGIEQPITLSNNKFIAGNSFYFKTKQRALTDDIGTICDFAYYTTTNEKLQSNIVEILSDMNYCIECGSKMINYEWEEAHDELDGSPKEEFSASFCPNCDHSEIKNLNVNKKGE